MKSLHNTSEHAGAPGPGTDAHAALDRLFALTVLMADTMEHDLRERGLTRARATLITALHEHGATTQRDLARALRVTPRYVTGLVDALERTGFVTRNPHPGDRRATLVTLTPGGCAAAEALAAARREFAALLFDRLDRTDVAGFRSTLEHLIERLQEPDVAERRRAALERWRSLPGRHRPTADEPTAAEPE